MKQKSYNKNPIGKKKKYKKKIWRYIATALALAALALGIQVFDVVDSLLPGDKVTDIKELSTDAGELPTYDENDGSPYCTVNGNQADFDDALIAKAAKGSFEDYGKLDVHKRCTKATACVSTDTMPARNEERGDISGVHPSGWKSGMNWERCHLIAWALSAENDNERNLITGTHMMNVEGMLPFEESICRYIDSTGNHVLYQVTPIYDGKNLIASGVHMMAWSVEDEGRGINFNIYCYNASPNTEIDYKTGVVKTLDSSDNEVSYSDRTYVINTNSGKFHYPSCQGAADIAEHNRKEVTAKRSELIDEGYEPCGMCEP